MQCSLPRVCIYLPSEAERDIENRFIRAQELYLAGDITREQHQVEKERYEKSKNNLRLEDANVLITLTDSLRTSLNNWDETLPIEKKKLLRMAVRAAFVRGDTIVALQPTEVFWPLTEPIRCQSGEGGRDLSSYHLTPLPASASKQENMRILRRRQDGGNPLPA